MAMPGSGSMGCGMGLALRVTGRYDMKYAIAWLLGVPISVLVVIYLVVHIL